MLTLNLAGNEFDPVADADGKPLLVVFVHKITRPGLGMSRGLTAYVESLKDKDANAAIAWLAAMFTAAGAAVLSIGRRRGPATD